MFVFLQVKCEKCGLMFEILLRENLVRNKFIKCELLLLTLAICRILCVTQVWYTLAGPWYATNGAKYNGMAPIL